MNKTHFHSKIQIWWYLEGNKTISERNSAWQASSSWGWIRTIYEWILLRCKGNFELKFYSKFYVLSCFKNLIMLFRQARIPKDVTERKLKHHNTKASCTNKNDMEEKCWKLFSKSPEENLPTKRNLQKNKTKIRRNLKKYFSL